MNYEENIKKLEEIIFKLENDDEGLDNSLKLYEEATNIIKNSYERLKEGKGKIVEINEKLEEVDFDVMK